MYWLQADLSRPTFLAAAFVLAARKARVRVDSRQVLEQLSTRRSDFNRVCEDMKERCFDLIGISTARPGAAASDGCAPTLCYPTPPRWRKERWFAMHRRGLFIRHRAAEHWGQTLNC